MSSQAHNRTLHQLLEITVLFQFKVVKTNYNQSAPGVDEKQKFLEATIRGKNVETENWLNWIKSSAEILSPVS